MHATRSIALASAFALASTAGAQRAPARRGAQQPFAVPPSALAWAQNPNLLPGGETAWLVGGPAQAGLYTYRVRFPAGFRVMPHTHPEDRVYTVVSGTWYIGLGTAFDTAKVQGYPAGTVYFLPANVPHFHYARSGETVAQVTGRGPTATVYVRRADDPRRR